MTNENPGGMTKAAFPFELVDSEGNAHSFRATPLNDLKHDELDNWVRARVINSARLAAPKITEHSTAEEIAERQELLNIAMQNSVGMSMFNGMGQTVLMTPQGCAELCWQLIRDEHPGVEAKNLVSFFRITENIERLGEAHRTVNPSMSKRIDDGGSEGNGESLT